RGFLQGALGGIVSGILAGCEKEATGPGSFAAVKGTSSAERAVEGARRFSGTSLKIGSETGQQAQELLRFSGPLWERLTGIRVDVVEIGSPVEQYHRIMAEHTARTKAFDCASIVPAWMPDLLAAGALEPLDEYMAHYMMPSDLDDYLPLYRSIGIWDGHRYGLFDDGDMLLLYYRRDLFEDERNQRAFESQYGRALGDPRSYDWRQFVDAARFFTKPDGAELYGMAPMQRELEWAWFQYLLRVNGGEFFDVETMRSMVGAEPGRRALEQLNQMRRFMPVMSSTNVASTTTLGSYLSGRAAMATFWPPLGRLAEGYGQEDAAGNVRARTQVAGKTGYALFPGGRTEAAVGFMLGVLSRSHHKEAAYLFIQWLTSPEVSLKRVMLPYSWRDPYRWSHVESPLYRSLWPSAGEYLDTLKTAASGAALSDLCVLSETDYEEAFYHTMTDIRMGDQATIGADQLSSRWDAITDRYGRNRQRAAYTQFLKRQNEASSRGKSPGRAM
ncbi:MAG TPA: extracellular solute-binding protein, partial [Tepidisphaeraceae bacterium]|nr:extracellular solute-binding protein [Tepidisphaeraceae bacterium]